jgi:HEAT repeat protein
MGYGKQSPPKLFTDEQMRRYVADGYVVFKPEVPDEVHRIVREKLQVMVDDEFNYGNNVLPRVPEMDRILNSPEVRGALISVLGPEYIEHPHRFCHYTGPDVVQKTLAQNCHQDSYTPLGRPRQHYSRFARIMYYPQDSPLEIGPTHAIAGTQYHKKLTEEDRHLAIPIAGQAGTVSITHFDIGHAAGINEIHQPRHMIKFIYARSQEPRAPSWDCQDTTWRQPEGIQAPFRLGLAWSHLWDWLCGKEDLYDSFRSVKWPTPTEPLAAVDAEDRAGQIDAMHAAAAARDAAAIPALVQKLNGAEQWTRLTAVYALGAIGEPAVRPLVDSLIESAAENDGDPVPKPWNEGAISMDDAAHALAAVGEPALAELIKLLDNPSEWVRINAAFALGEKDSAAASAVPALTRCLADASHCVVRTATDALSAINRDQKTFIPALGRLLKKGRTEWDIPARRDWTPYDQVRINAAMAFTRLGKEAAPAEALLLETLADPNGHVAAHALDALRRIGTPSAMEGVVAYLLSRRWDESLTKARTF